MNDQSEHPRDHQPDPQREDRSREGAGTDKSHPYGDEGASRGDAERASRNNAGHASARAADDASRSTGPGGGADGARASAQFSFEATRRPRRLRRWTLAGIAAVAASAFAFHSVIHAQGGPGFMHRHGKMDAETMGKFVDWRVSAMLSKVDATPEQKARITEIAKTAMKDLTPLREQHQAARSKAMDLLVQPTIDRAALEQVRAEELRLAETLSRRAAQVVADAAEVLTPAQRQQLVERWKARHA